MKRKRAKWLLRIGMEDGRQYWQVPIPRCWMELFGYGYIAGGLLHRFLVQRRHRKNALATGRTLDKLAEGYTFTRRFAESDAAFRERIMRHVGRVE
jgi:hypothetical protein